jgi:hypothetical protein
MENKITFADKCRQLGISDNKHNIVRNYCKRYPELTDEQAIQKWLEAQTYLSDKEQHELCKKYKIGYHSMMKVRSEYNMTAKQAIDFCVKIRQDKIKNIMQICKDNNIEYKEEYINLSEFMIVCKGYKLTEKQIATARAYKAQHPELKTIDVVKRELNKNTSFNEICRQHGFTEKEIKNISNYRVKHKELSDTEVINKYENKEVSFSELCREYNVKRSNVISYISNRPELKSLDDKSQIESYIAFCSNKSFSERCREAGLNEDYISKAHDYKKSHKDLNDNDIIDTMKEKQSKGEIHKRKNISVQLRGLGFDETIINNFLAYRRKHPELSDEQIIQYYRPYLVINIFGELIEYKEKK